MLIELSMNNFVYLNDTLLDGKLPQSFQYYDYIQSIILSNIDQEDEKQKIVQRIRKVKCQMDLDVKSRQEVQNISLCQTISEGAEKAIKRMLKG